MFWIFFVILAYFFLAVSVFIDRLLMKGPLKSPFAYAFYAAALNSLVILFLLLNVFFDFLEPVSGLTIILGILTGFIAVWTLLVWFILVSKEEVSRASPVVGALQPILIVGISLLFFLEHALPSLNEISAFVLFLVGSVMIVKKPGGFPLLKNHTNLFILSAFYFALSWMLLKVLFVLTGFWTALVLVGIGSVIGAATLLFLPETRTDLAKKGLPIQKGLLIPFFIGRAAGAFGAIFQLAAIFFATIPQVPLIGALTGIQFLFLYLLLFFFVGKFPEMKEEMSGKTLLKKLGGIAIIGLGFLALVL